MTTVFNRTRIQEALVSRAKGYSFPVVRYNKDGSPIAVNPEQSIQPALPIIVNEVNTSFDVDNNTGRKLTYLRNNWTFQLKIDFNDEVIVDEFVNNMLTSPVVLGPEGTVPSVVVRLVDMAVEHSTQGGAGSGGTLLELVFLAQEGRR